MQDVTFSEKKEDGRGRSLSLDKAIILSKMIKSCEREGKKWTKAKALEEADKLCVDWRTVVSYQKNPRKLDLLIGKLQQADNWAYFFEGMRLLSTPMKDLKEYMAQYIQYLESPQLLVNMYDGKRKALGSTGNFYDRARQCFDINGANRTVRERRADTLLTLTMSNNLTEWPLGTVGVHTVPIRWDLDHYLDSKRVKDYSETGGQIGLMMLAERKIGLYKAIAFFPVLNSTTDMDKANAIKEFLQDIKAPNKVVRLVTGKRETGFAPTTMDKDVLQKLIGNMAKVEEDAPTVGLKTDFPVSSKKTDAFKVKGRYKSSNDLCAYLHNLLNKGYRCLTN